ncbi:MAG: DUF4476 domain-containing protein [Polyangiaceae bacterium]|nr:DUF4476 domain-containing protein [Polyangiaceae bacterium]
MSRHRLTTMLTAALALLGPAAAYAQEPARPAPLAQGYPQYPGQPYQGYPPEPQRGYPPPGYRGAPPYQGYQAGQPYPRGRGRAAPPWRESQARLRVVPPHGATVTIHDGPFIVGRTSRPGAFMVWPGHEYRVIARRGRDVLWSGHVTPAMPALDLRWNAQAGELLPYTLPPPIDWSRGHWLLTALEGAWSDADRVALVRGEAARHAFTSAQAGAILARIQHERPRVQALAALAPRIADPEHAGGLLRHFHSDESRRRAADLLGWR